MSTSSSAYGDRHALVYNRIYGMRFAPAAAVAAIAAAAGDGPVLELGVGTGRLAIPLAKRGVVVDGIEGSAAMIAQLRAESGGDRVGVFRADLGDFVLPRVDYAVAVCAVSTLFMLDHDAQRGCFSSVAAHLRPSGLLFIEAFQPDPTRFDTAGNRFEQRPAVGGVAHRVRSHHDPHGRSIAISHELISGEGADAYDVTLYYATISELDDMAAAVGLALVERWADWTGAVARNDSTDPISVYQQVAFAAADTS